MLYDRSCRGRGPLPGLSHAWSAGGALYRALGQIDACHGAWSWAEGLDYSRVPLPIARQVYESVRNAIIYYAGVHYEQSGDLEWVHSVDGVRTLRQEFDKVAAHNENHLRQIRTALGRPAA